VTVGAGEMALYGLGLLVLFLTPGPVWVALTARALSGGFSGAWPLAVGVALGDALWPMLAVFGLAWAVASVEGALEAMKFVAAAIFLIMGWGLLRRGPQALSTDSRLMRPGRWAGFAAGVAVIVGNPKAILFYMGVLPGFFDLARIGAADIAAIVALSVAVPLVGNLCIAVLIDRVRRLMRSATALRRMNLAAGLMMVAVGLVIPFT